MRGGLFCVFRPVVRNGADEDVNQRRWLRQSIRLQWLPPHITIKKLHSAAQRNPPKKSNLFLFRLRVKSKLLVMFMYCMQSLFINDVKLSRFESIYVYGFCPYGRFSPIRHSFAIHRTHRTILHSFIQTFRFVAGFKA